MKVNLPKTWIKNKIKELDDDIYHMQITQGKYPTDSRRAYIKLLDEKRASYKRLLPYAHDLKAHREFKITNPKFKIDAKHQKGRYV